MTPQVNLDYRVFIYLFIYLFISYILQQCDSNEFSKKEWR